MKKRNIYLLFLLIGFSHLSFGQSKVLESLWKKQYKSEFNFHSVAQPKYLEIKNKEILQLIDDQPSFGMYHDNYFTTGVPTNEKINKSTADAKFQISIRQRLTKSQLPLNTSFYLTYTQKSFWDIYEKSSPFEESNYKPGLTLMTPVISDNKLIGATTLSFEHESNGLDGEDSRSWNYASFSWVHFYNYNFTFQAKLWVGVVSKENHDLFHYRGYGLLALNYRNNKENLWLSLVINPNDDLTIFNTTAEINYKLSKNDNQYLFLQWYNGYGESLIDYDKYTSMVRVGICLKPKLRNFY